MSEDIGLHLTDITIRKISGPVSIYYLKPKSSLLLKYKRENLPLILLWGDIHREAKGICDPCEDDEKKGCYKIYDKKFLREFDKLASKYPVDFYTEYSPHFPLVFNPDDVLFYRFLQGTTKECHKKELRSKKKYNTSCPTQYIRWHYSDIRFTQNTIEKYIFYPESDILTEALTEYDEEFQVIESEINQTSLDNLYKFTKIVNKKIRITYPFKGIYAEKYDDGYQIFKDMLVILMEPSIGNNYISKYRRVFAIYIKYISSHTNSIIYKQIRKFESILQTNEELLDFITTGFYNYYEEAIQKYESFLMSIPEYIHTLVIESITNPIYYTKTKIDSPFSKIKLDDVKNCIWMYYGIQYHFQDIGAFIVDLYTICRMIKPPVGSSSPYLVMGFFGNAHIKNLVNILQLKPWFDYELVYMDDKSINNSNNMRCLTIHQSIPLFRDLEDRAHTIRTNPINEKSYQNYHRVLRKEENEKNMNRILQIEIGGKRKTRKIVSI